MVLLSMVTWIPSIYPSHVSIYMAVCQNLVPLVNIKIAGKWMFIPLKMVLIGIDPYPYTSTMDPMGYRWLNNVKFSADPPYHVSVATAPRHGTMKTSATFGSQVRQGCVIIIRTKYLEAENSCLRGVSQNLLEKKNGAIFRHSEETFCIRKCITWTCED